MPKQLWASVGVTKQASVIQNWSESWSCKETAVECSGPTVLPSQLPRQLPICGLSYPLCYLSQEAFSLCDRDQCDMRIRNFPSNCISYMRYPKLDNTFNWKWPVTPQCQHRPDYLQFLPVCCLLTLFPLTAGWQTPLTWSPVPTFVAQPVCGDA
jgi:hypothetical protein